MLLLLSLLDIIGGLSLVFSWTGIIVFIIGLLILIKGIFSVIGSLIAKHFLDWMGWIDIITGIMLITGFFIPLFWILPIAKGLYSVLFSL